jgi:hypothetical protein
MIGAVRAGSPIGEVGARKRVADSPPPDGPKNYLLDWVSVVVVVTGAGTVVWDDVVVVLCVGSLAQAESEISATATRQGTMSFFMDLVLI